ncbi:MAG: radical SAM protein, partial [Patescibacteria group bacterium]
CIGVPIHGKNFEIHEYCNNVKGSFKKTLNNIAQYVQDGFDVRCIPVLTSLNYDHMFEIIRKAANLGMESVFVDRFEDGGIGSKNSAKLKPTLEQFRTALDQMISAKNEFGIKVGFGTAIPYCIDERLISENMISDCGAGLTFAAIRPNGDVRACNQSDIIYGNILQNSFKEIWSNSKFDKFRDLSWVSGICLKCNLLTDCVCGCKVDANCSNGYCVDYAVRDLLKCPTQIKQLKNNNHFVVPNYFRKFAISKYFKINEEYSTKFFVTRYQTVVVDPNALEIAHFIFDNNICSEKQLIEYWHNEFYEKDLRKFISQMAQIGAINIF